MVIVRCALGMTLASLAGDQAPDGRCFAPGFVTPDREYSRPVWISGWCDRPPRERLTFRCR